MGPRTCASSCTAELASHAHCSSLRTAVCAVSVGVPPRLAGCASGLQLEAADSAPPAYRTQGGFRFRDHSAAWGHSSVQLWKLHTADFCRLATGSWPVVGQLAQLFEACCCRAGREALPTALTLHLHGAAPAAASAHACSRRMIAAAAHLLTFMHH